MNFVGPIVSTIGQYALAPLGRQFGYLIFHEANLNSLKSQSEKLKIQIATVQQEVHAKENTEDILPEVKQWLTEADDYSQLAQTLQDKNEANKWCFKWCPNLKSLYSLGKKAKKLADDMEKVRVGGNFSQVSTPKPAPSIVPTFEKDTKSFESRATVMENVMQALRDDKIHMIGICGMGGVGKTTMAKEVMKRADELKSFDKAVMVPVSQTPDVRKIQDDIAFFLDLRMPSNAETVDARACWLFERIKELEKMKKVERILFVLDDIWTKLELNRIGIPFKDHKGCKILLTSRREQAVKDTGPESRIFKVDVLDEEEAWSLFKEKAGISEDSIHPADLLDIQKAVANECGRLPLALVTVGGALRDKDTYDWKDARRKLQNCEAENIEGVDENLYRSLKYSYDMLGSEEAKKCFLLCSMYPEDYEIPVEDLVRYGFAKKLFKGIGTVGEARVAAYSTINTLKKCNLLLDSVRSEEHVKMHDVLRDVAISFASKEGDPFMIRYDDEALEDSSECRRYDVISLQNLRECEQFNNFVFPKLWLFRLKGDGGPLEIPNNFYRGMKNLKVVALSSISIQSLPTSLGDLHALSIEECEVKGNMSVIGELKSLEILSLKRSKVKELPFQMTELTRLKLLDLYECEIEMIHPGVLSSLSSLEEIYMGEVRKPLSEHIAELSSLPNVMVLSIALDDRNLWPRNWTVEKMENFNIRLGHGVLFPTYKLDNELLLKGIDVSAIKESGLRRLLKSSRLLYLERVRGLKNIFDDLGEDNFECLTSLRLRDCETIEYLLNTTHERAFPVMESLELSNLARMRKICRPQPQKGTSNAITSSSSNSKVLFATLKELYLSSLPELIGNPLWKYEYDCHQQIQEGSAPIRIDWLSNLTNLDLFKCDKLESVFSAPVARGLMQLKNISISCCQLIEGVVIPNEGGDIYKGKKAITEEEEEIMFPKLEELNFWNLPSFSSFWKVRTTINMPQLKSLELIDLQEMTSFCLLPTTSNSNQDPVIQSFFNKVTFPVIESLTLWGLPRLRKICDTQPQKGSSNAMTSSSSNSKVVFATLKGLELIGLPELIGNPLWKYEYDPHQQKQEGYAPVRIDWLSNLTNLSLEYCNKIESMFVAHVARGLMQLKNISISNCELIETVVIPSEGGDIYKAKEAITEEKEEEEEEEEEEEIMFPKLEELNFRCLPSFSSFSKVRTAINMPQLKSLTLADLPKIPSLCLSPTTTNSNHDPVIQSLFNKVLFATLKELNCINVLELIGNPLWKYEYYHHQQKKEGPTPFRIDWLSNLSKLSFEQCHELESVFSAAVARDLMQLKHISIINCKLIEALVISSEGGDIYKAREATIEEEEQEEEEEEIMFPKLERLDFQELPCFSSFCKVRTSIKMPQLKILKFVDLPKMTSLCLPPTTTDSNHDPVIQSSFNKVLFATLKEVELKYLPELIGNPLWKYEYDRHQQKQEGSAPFRIDWPSNLTNLSFEQCHKLESVFSATVARDLMQLKHISIINCKLIEALVIPSEGGDIYKAREATIEEEEEIMFPELERLDFQELPCFSSFCKVRTSIKMPQLKILKFVDLPKMTSLFLPPTTTDSNHDPVIHSSFNKVTLPSLEEVELSFMDNLMETWPRELQVPLKLKKLRVHFCPRLLNGDLLPSNWMHCGMRDLENVKVKDYQSLEVVFNLQGLTATVKELGDADPVVALPVLQNLDLIYLPKLTHVWKINATSPSSFQGFQKLTDIKIKGCSSLRNLFPICVAKLLQSLEKLEILECGAMEAIFAVEDPKVDDHDNDRTSSASMIILLPQLEILNLRYLPNLRSLCPQGFTIPGTRLMSLTVVCCPNIKQHCRKNVDGMKIIPKSIDIRHLDGNGKVILPCSDGEPILVTGMDESTNNWYRKVDKKVQRHLHEAKSIWFLCCEELLSVISSNLIGRLHNLASLEVWGCTSMEAIFDLIEFACKEESVSQLKELRLKYLPKLTQLWKNTPQQSHYHFQGLKYLTVQNCDRLRYILTASMAKALVNLERLEIACCEKVEKIVARDEGDKGEKEEEEETGKLLKSRCHIKLENLPNLICLGPEEDDSQFWTRQNSWVEVKFCRKYRGFQNWTPLSVDDYFD